MEIEQFEGEPRKLRLNQLMMTEAFGDGTYESLEVEAQKARYAELYALDSPSDSQVEEMEELQTEIGHLALQDQGSGMTEEQIQLLADVKQALAGDQK